MSKLMDSYPLHDTVKDEFRKHRDFHWDKTKGFSDGCQTRIAAMQLCYAMAKHRGAEEIKRMIDWMHEG